MATYDNLPVFKASYALLLLLFNGARHMQRDYRYTLGERMKNDMLELVVLIFRANSRPEKKPYLSKARERIEVVRLMLRLAHDLKQLPLKNFALASEKVESISKQLAAWEKSCTN
jgi:hypothetical protein